MHRRLIREGDSWLEVAVKIAIVACICFGMGVYAFSIGPAIDARNKLKEAEGRLAHIRRAAEEIDKAYREKRAAASEIDRQLEQKQKELSWLDVSLEKKSVEKTFLLEELADLENRFAEVKLEAIRAYLLQMMSEAIQESIRRERTKGRGKSGRDPFDVREYALTLSQTACRESEEGSYKYAAAKLFEEFARENLPKKGSTWEDLIAIIHWYPARLPDGTPKAVKGG